MCWSTNRCWIRLTCSKCTYPISKKKYFSNAEYKDWKMVNRLPNHCVILSDEWWLHKLRCWCEYWQSCLEGKQIWLTKHHNQVSYLIHGVIHHWFNVATKLRWPPSNLDLEKQRYHVNWKKIESCHHTVSASIPKVQQLFLWIGNYLELNTTIGIFPISPVSICVMAMHISVKYTAAIQN